MPKVKDKGPHVPKDHPYWRMTMKELTEQLQKRGADVLGRKADLVARLESWDKNSNLVASTHKAILDMDTDTKFLLCKCSVQHNSETDAQVSIEFLSVSDIDIRLSPTVSNEMNKCTDTSIAKPWEEKHEEGQKMVTKDKPLQNVLFHSMSLLASEMVLSDEFWNMLLHKGVVDEKFKSDLQAFDSQELQVHDLVGHLMKGKVHQVHGFFWVLVNTKQQQLVEMLGFPARNYFDVQPMLKSSCINCPSCVDVFSTKAYILVQCGHYVCRPCYKGACFSVEADKTEAITCPVPDCGEVTKTLPNSGQIGLEEDDVFMGIVGDLMKDRFDDEICHLCSSDLSLSFRKHFCTGCKKLLCGACINRHIDYGHEVIHKHAADVCCLHGKKTETFCLKCNIFRCQSKEEEPCEHQDSSGDPENKNTSLEHMINQDKIISDKVKEYKMLDEGLEKRRAEMVEFVEHHRDEVKRVIDEWSDGNLSYISRITRQLRVKHKQSLQWKALSSDLIGIQKEQPWVDLPLDSMDLTLPFEVQAFVSKVRDGEPPSKILCGVPYLPAPAPRKANFMAEWQIPWSEYSSSLAWTPDGQLLVTTSTGLHQVNYNMASTTFTASLIHGTTEDPMQISIAEDGSWIMTEGETGNLVINDVNKGEVREWTPPGIHPYTAAIDNSGIYVKEQTSSIIYLYSRDLVEQTQYQIDPEWNCELSYIHLSQTGDILFNICTSNYVIVMDPKTGVSRSFERKGTKRKPNSHVDLCTVVGGEYILVSELRNHCVSVFTYQGYYLHDIQIEGGAGWPSNVSVLERPGEPTLMALECREGNDEFLRSVKLYTLS